MEFQSPAFQGTSKVFPNLAGMFASIFVFTAAISAYHAWRRGELLDRQTSVKSIKAVSWKDFEYLVSVAYRRKGYTFGDFVRIGLPLTLIMWLILSWLLPRQYGF